MLILNYSVLNSQICITHNLYNTNSIVYIHMFFSLNSAYSQSILEIHSFTMSSDMKNTKIFGIFHRVHKLFFTKFVSFFPTIVKL